MDSADTKHPSDQQLRAFGLGKLDDALARIVGAHIATCEWCQTRAGETGPDSFLMRMKVAGARPVSSESFGSSFTDRSMIGGGLVTAPLVVASALPPGMGDLSDYEILAELGRGGMGVVYLANNRLMGRVEVLKVINRELMSRRIVVERFLVEIRNAARLQHPNIVAAYSALRLGDHLILAMEYVKGDDLAKRVRVKGPLQVTHACYFAYQAALGLQHAYERGMVHRDIKPANLMLAADGKKATIKILDFGLAKATHETPVDGGLTREGQMLGTPDYLAPEQSLNAQKADIRADIYSLGCTMYYLLAGRPPFKGDSLYQILQAHHSIEAMPLNLVRPEVPVELAALIGKMMAKEPERRFQNPAEVAQALTPFFKPAAARQPPAIGDAYRDNAAWASRNIPPIPPLANTGNATGPVSATLRETARRASDVPWEVLINTKTTGRAAESACPGNSFRDLDPRIDRQSHRQFLLVGSIVATVLLITASVGYAVFNVNRTMTRVDDQTKSTENSGNNARQASLPGPTMSSADDTTKSTEDTRRRARQAQLPRPEITGGDWAIEGDELIQSNELTGGGIVFGDPEWSDYDLSLEVQKIKGDDHGVQIVFHRQSEETFCWFGLGVFNNQGLEAYFQVNAHNRGRGGDNNNDNYQFRGINEGDWYKVLIEVRKSRFKFYMDGHLVFDESHSSFSKGRVALRTSKMQAKFRRVKVTEPGGSVILFEGLPELPQIEQAIRFTRPTNGLPPLAKATELRQTIDPNEYDQLLAEFAPDVALQTRAVGNEDFGLTLYPEYRGRQAVLRTHPVSRHVPCVLRTSVIVPRKCQTKLQLSVSHYVRPDSDWQLIVRANHRTLYNEPIGPASVDNDGWADVEVDLSAYAGETVALEIWNQSNGWSFEFGYWGRIAVVSSE